MINLKKETKIEFVWTCTMRVNQLKIPILKKMKEAGCVDIGFGFESASDIVLKSMVKKIKKSEIINAIKMCEETGIGVQANFIFGDPVETIETQKETVDFFFEYCINHIVHNGLISPFPGSPLWTHCIENNVITDKKVYYENIHKSNGKNNLMNMTKIRDEDFFTEIEKILVLEDSLFKPVKILDVLNDKNYNVKAKCPHCRKIIRFKYPRIDAGDKVFHKINASKPFVNFCPECHKRILIPTINVFRDLKVLFDDYIEHINKIADLNEECAVILGNEIRHLETYINTTKILESNGLNLSNLNISSFYALKKEEKDNKILGYSLQILNEDSLNDSMKYIILPHDEQSKVVSLLKHQHVKDENIVFLDFK